MSNDTFKITKRQAALALIKRKQARITGAKSYCPHSPTPKQQAFVEYSGLEGLYGGAAGGGKSDALLMSALKYVHVQCYAALILRRTFPDLSLKGAIMDRSHDWLRGSDAIWDAQNKRWRFPSGASLTFGYLENPGDELRYQGAEFQYIGIDEVTQFLRPQYTYMFSRLRKANVDVPLRMRGATNPGGIGHTWIKERFAIPDEVRMDEVYIANDRAFFPAVLDDNPFIDRDSYERSLAQLEYVTRQQLRYGSWRQDTSTLVYSFDEDRDCIEGLPKLPHGMTWINVLGIDYGNINATAMVVVSSCVEFSDIVYILEAEKWSGLDPSAAAQTVASWSARYGGFQIMVGDVGGLGKGYAEEARNRWGLPIEAAQKSNKMGYVKLINGAYQTGKLKLIKAGCLPLIKELKEHPWKDGKPWLEEQPGSPNHCADAHLYGWREQIAWAHKAQPAAQPKYGTKEWYVQEEQRIRNDYAVEAMRDPFEIDPWAQ